MPDVTNPWRGFLPRLVASILGTTIGIVLAMFIVYEYVSAKLEKKVDDAKARVENFCPGPPKPP